MLKLRYVKSVRFFSRIRTEYEEIRSACPYSVRMRENADHKTPNTDTFYAVLKSRFPNEIIFNTFRTNIPSFQDFPRILESIEVNGDMSTKCADYHHPNVVQNCMEIYGLKPSPK